jgi:hypothetical protein
MALSLIFGCLINRGEWRAEFFAVLGVPVELVIVDTEDFSEELGIIGKGLGSGGVDPMQGAGVLTRYFDGVDLGIVGFAVPEKAGRKTSQFEEIPFLVEARLLPYLESI